MKKCRGCGENKPLDQYYVRATGRDGRAARCKACTYTPVTERKRMATLHCYMCDERKPRDQFYKNTSHCKDCGRERNKGRKRSPEVNARKNNKRRAAECPKWHYDLAKLTTKVCVKCGSDGPLQFDHIMPLALGGKSDFFNFQMLCADCNNKKSATYAHYEDYSGGVVVETIIGKKE